MKNNFDNADSIARLGEWTTNLLRSHFVSERLKVDQVLFSLAYAAMYQFSPNLLPTKADTSSPETRKELREMIQQLDRRFGPEVTSKYGNLLFAGHLLYEEMSSADNFARWDMFVRTAQENAKEIKNDFRTSQEESCNLVQKLLKLSPTEMNILEFQVMRTDFSFSQFYERLFATFTNSYFTLEFLQNMFGAEQDEIVNALSKTGNLRKSGLLNYNESNGRLTRLSESMQSWFLDKAALSANAPSAMFGKLVKPLSKKQSASGSIGSLTPVDKTLIMNLIDETTVIPPDPGTFAGKNKTAPVFKAINILAYGNSKIDKKNAISKMFEDTDYHVYALETANVPSSDLAARTYLAQRWLQKVAEADQEKVVFIVEQADDVLTRRRSSMMSEMFGVAEKEDDEEETLETDEILLAENPVTTMWIVDRPKDIIEDNVGRFLFHCEVKPGSRADRRAEIDAIVKDLQLSDEVKVHLSKYQLLSANQVKSAAALAGYVGKTPETQEDILKRGIEQSQKALQRNSMEELRESVTTYSLDLINTKGAFTPQQIITAFQKRPAGTLCLYGMPGTGKTQFAEYLAMQLDKPLLMKRGSDLLGKYVGENEKNIRDMFAEATETEAILFVDEIDSFMRDRSMAKAEWSVSQVNELLQQMERFKGIFVGATNLMKDIDAAALRRFTFKFEFLALTDEQRWKMFINEAKIDSTSVDVEVIEENAYLLEELTKIKHLTPGDFAVVKRQSNLLGETLNPEQWLEQLAMEAKAKMHGIERQTLGFT